MLPLGRIGIRGVQHDRWTNFTKDEQVTMMTLWTLFRSPLMFGGEMRDNDEWTLSLLTNQDVLNMHRHSYGARQIIREGDQIVWLAEGPEGERFVALFNTGELLAEVSVSIADLGMGSGVKAKELWSGEQTSLLEDTLSAAIPPHGAALFRVAAE